MHTQGGCRVKMKIEINEVSVGQGSPKIASKPQKLGKEHGTDNLSTH